MGLLSSLFSSKTTQKNDIHVDPRYQQFLDFALGQAQNAYGQGFTPYTGQRFSEFNADEMAGFDLARLFANPTGPAADLEKMALDRFMGAPTNQDLEGFINPYAEGVVDRTTNKLTSNFDRALANQRASTLGSFGGSRQAVLESQMTDDFLENVGDIQYRGLADAYDKGLDRYYQTGLNAFQMSGDAQARNLSRSNALLGIGGTQRALDQSNLDFNFAEFMRSINEPKQDALSLSQIGAQYPTQIFDSTQTTKSTPSPFDMIGKVAGLAMGVAGGFGAGGGGIPSTIAGGGSGGGFSFGSNGLSYSTPNFNVGLGQPIIPSGGSSGYYLPGFGGSYGYKDGGLVKMANGGQPEDYEPEYPYEEPISKGIRNLLSSLSPPEDTPIFNTQGPAVDSRKTAQYLFGLEKGAGPRERKPTPAMGKERTFDEVMNMFGGRRTAIEPSVNFDRPMTPSNKSKSAVMLGLQQPMDQQPGPVQVEDIFDFGKPNEHPERQEEKANWLDRWVDNPLTELGLSLLASDDDSFGRMATRLLDTRKAEKAETTRQFERSDDQVIEAERIRVANQMARDNELNRRREKQAELDMMKKRYDQEYAADMARIAVSKEANKTAKEDMFMTQINSQLNNLHDRRNDLLKQKGSLDPRIDSTYIDQELETIDDRLTDLRVRFDENAKIPSVRKYNPKTGKLE